LEEKRGTFCLNLICVVLMKLGSNVYEFIHFFRILILTFCTCLTSKLSPYLVSACQRCNSGPFN